MNENIKISAGLGIAEALRLITRQFAQTNIRQAETEARMLMRAATNLSRAQFIAQPDRKLSISEAQTIDACIERRMAGEPVTRIIGQREFWTLDLLVAPNVLDPRADTEVIVETALDLLGQCRNEPLRILDLGTGTGALLLALLAECPKATGIGIDLSPFACSVAQRNAERNGLSSRAIIRQGNWDEGLDEQFNLVVSNPPYIETSAIAGLDREVRNHDPVLALDGGADGLNAYRAIISALPRVMASDGDCILELGLGQAKQVSTLSEKMGLAVNTIRRDLGGIERALALGWPA